jgi:adenosine deaminase
MEGCDVVSRRSGSPPLSADVSIPPWVAALPKADLHVHAETDARLDRILARRQAIPAYNWRHWAERLRAETPPGMPRPTRLASDRRREQVEVDAIDAMPEDFIARVADLLSEGAADGAILIEVRFGRTTLQRPEFMALFREAERRVRVRYPRLRAEAVISGLWPSTHDPDGRLLQSCIAASREGLAGIDLIPIPYATEADWTTVESWAAAAADAGLGITAHAGEFSPANVAAALRLPGLTRLGHAVHAATDNHLLEQIARAGVTVECALTCNVVLGAVESYESHPIRQFVAHGIPVALGTDDPVRVATTIGREYAIAAALGFTHDDLIGFTQNATKSAFVAPERRSDLLHERQPLP